MNFVYPILFKASSSYASHPHSGTLVILSSTDTYPQSINLLKPTGYVMRHQFNIQQLYALPTLYLCVLYLSENKQRLVPLTADGRMELTRRLKG
jgi:hypothetical protein